MHEIIDHRLDRARRDIHGLIPSTRMRPREPDEPLADHPGRQLGLLIDGIRQYQAETGQDERLGRDAGYADGYLDGFLDGARYVALRTLI